MRKLLLAIACMSLWGSVASAQNIYIAQNTAGADSGSDCTDAHSAAWFNSAANWGSGAAQIGAATVVHLCGTFTGTANSTMLTTRGNGITIHFETGALLQSPAWGQNGAISVPNNSVTIDGGTNGTIENTLNGTQGGACLGGPCSVEQASVGVVVTGSNDTVENLTITHIGVHTFGVNDPGAILEATSAIQLDGSSDIATQNTIDNVASGIGGSNGSEISYNTITFANHAIAVGIVSGTWTGIKIHNNDVSQLYNWDEPDNNYHHNGIMLFSTQSGVISGIQIYYNYLHGLWSNDSVYGDTHVTAWVFLDTNGIPNSIPNAMIFRNVFEADAGSYNYPADGYVGLNGCLVSTGCTPANASLLANNTVVGNGRCWSIGDASNAPSSLNNLCATTSGATLSTPSTMPYPTAQIDYNMYAGVGTVNAFGLPCANGSCNINTYTAWSSSPHSLDVHGSNPTRAAVALTSSNQLGSGSVAIGKAKNLTSAYCTEIPALCVGAPSIFGVAGAGAGGGTPASTTGAWDAGAYPSGSSVATQPSAPTGLTAVVN
jgi:hypothetical protein